MSPFHIEATARFCAFNIMAAESPPSHLHLQIHHFVKTIYVELIVSGSYLSSRGTQHKHTDSFYKRHFYFKLILLKLSSSNFAALFSHFNTSAFKVFVTMKVKFTFISVKINIF